MAKHIGPKTRGNYSLGLDLDQDEFDGIFKLKRKKQNTEKSRHKRKQRDVLEPKFRK